MIEDYLNEMKRFVPPEARILSCQFAGDPDEDIYQKWRARVVREVHNIDDRANVYLCVSAMQRNDRQEFRRRKENFAGGLLLMVDDIGEGKGSKFPLSVLDPLPPTALVETSPGNFQAHYFFDRLVTDMAEFDSLIRAFIDEQFLSADTGMAGVNRVFRPPVGINGKQKYRDESGRPWQVRCERWEPSNRYSVQEIAKAFNLQLVRERRAPQDSNYLGAAKPERIRAFAAQLRILRGCGMLKREEPDVSGWIQISCPWIHEHSDEADTGAAIRLPEAENDWWGAFRCHHGHCAERGWKELTQYLSEEVGDWLEMVNANCEGWVE